MIRFLIYLFESGMCLTLLYLVYYLFLRKETYFTFNRIYLISILIFSLLFPLIHINFTLPKSKVLESRVEEINNFKNYYEYLISLTDPDYANSFTLAFQQNKTESFNETSGAAFSSRAATSNSVANENIQNKKTGFWASMKLANILLNLYLLGILFFAGRLLLLFRWINQTLKKYGSTVENNVLLVKMDEEVPPFSFFRFVFLNKETHLHPGFEQIVTHEKVHINQWHSLDLLLAHSITVFQWFNPFAWLINKAMKTNHEYIADRSVVEQGYELFDYLSLLLKQIISIRSVELINNFNLINIKKRIAMMTKIKSGLASQLKALVVIPAAIFMFFFFAEISFAQETIGFKSKDCTEELQGFWKNVDNSSYGMLLNFKGNKVYILENTENYREISIQIPVGSVGVTAEHFYKTDISKYTKNTDELNAFHTLPLEPHKSKLISFILKDDQLIVGWTPEKVSIYERSKASSSIGAFSNKMGDYFEPVTTSYYRMTDNPDKSYYLFMDKEGQMFVDGEQVESTKLIEKIKEVKRTGNPFGADEKVPIIVVDARCEMAYVGVMCRNLQEMGELRHILSVKPRDEKVPEILYHNVGIPRLFPLKEAVKMASFEEIEKSNLKIIRIDLTKIKSETDNSQLQEIKEGENYAILYTYKNKTTFQEYMGVIDEVYLTIHQKRNVVAQKKYNLDYDELAGIQQKEIREIFPLVLIEKNVDWVDYR